MARRTTEVEPFEENIVDIDVTEEMQGSFLEYAYSVIYARALPDARDGLKPVQRRILFQMSQMNLRPDRPYVKSARVVGDVMGKLHPHGDTAIYDALVRMAQDFSLRLPTVDGHGNFGSLDDGPAAPRYTEARLAPAAMDMVADLDEDVVDLVPNYDNKQTQPEVLPAAWPHLLVNGATGIAVGMATNMAPHNLVEVVAAARHLLAHPDATLAELMRFVPGPDLPTGGKIVNLDGVRDAYRTGRGSFRTRATTRVENVTARRKAIVVTELPYLVGPEKVIEKIKEGVQAKKLTGIAAVADFTDRNHGLRLVIELKSGFNPDGVLEQLFRHTPMEDSFSINNVCLVDGRPRTLGLAELLRVWVDHRVTVVRRRSAHRLARRQERLHLVEGLLVAILDIDEVIAVIRSSDDAQIARDRLVAVFDLTEVQADYILELRLRRLTKFSRVELEREAEDLRQQIAELESILGDPARLREVVGAEMTLAAQVHGTPRRTVLLESAGPARTGPVAQADVEIADTPCWALLSATGLLARTADGAAPARPTPEDRRVEHDVLHPVVETSARGEIGVLTSRGLVHRLPVVDLPALPPTQGPPGLAGGVPARELLGLAAGERPIALVSLSPQAPPLALGTAQGVVKRVNPGDVPAKGDSWPAIAVRDGDEVVGGAHAPDDAELVLIASDAQLLRFPADAVRPQGRAGGGMAGIRLAAGAQVVAFGVVPAGADGQVVTVAGSGRALPGTEAGTAKVTPLRVFPPKGRATGGVAAHRFLKDEAALILAWAGPGPARATGGGGQAIALPDVDERRAMSGTPLAAPVHAVG